MSISLIIFLPQNNCFSRNERPSLVIVHPKEMSNKTAKNNVSLNTVNKSLLIVIQFEKCPDFDKKLKYKKSINISNIFTKSAAVINLWIPAECSLHIR